MGDTLLSSAILDLVAQLVDKSLVQVKDGGPVARYREVALAAALAVGRTLTLEQATAEALAIADALASGGATVAES